MERPNGLTGAQGGLALIAVLWLVALLSVLALSATAVVTRDRRLGAGAFELRAAELEADGAVRMALLELLQPPSGVPPAAPVLRQLQVGSREVEVRVERERGRIDLNTGDPGLLAAYFVASGQAAGEARALVARLRDWTDPDDQTRPGGAERGEYLSARRPWQPRNGPLEAVEELRQVLGGEDLSPEVLDGLTVYTHAEVAFGADAPPMVRRALTQWETGTVVNRVAGETSGIAWAGEVVRATACVQVREANRVCRMAIVRLTGRGDGPWQVFLWWTTFELRREAA